MSATSINMNKEMAALLTAVIAAAASLTAALTAGLIAMRNEKSRQQHSVEILALQLDRAQISERKKLLREAAAEFSLRTIHFAEQAAAVERAMLALSPTGKISRNLEQKLREANGEIRMQFQVLLLITESVTVQEAARSVLRGA